MSGLGFRVQSLEPGRGLSFPGCSVLHEESKYPSIRAVLKFIRIRKDIYLYMYMCVYIRVCIYIYMYAQLYRVLLEV